MNGNCTYNIDANNISNNVIVNNDETNNFRKISTTFVIYMVTGATMLNFAPRNCIDSNNYAQPYEVFSSRSIGKDSFIIGATLDLLKVENINKIHKIGGFENDWNGNGAKKFSSESINMFLEVIDTLCKQPQIAPTGKGSLLMQYEKENGSMLAFDVAFGKVEKVFVPNGKYECADIEIFTEDICSKMNRSVERFYEIG